jgi:hypothetical protein
MRSLLIAIAWVSQLVSNCEGSAMDDLAFAPAKPDPDEEVVTDHAGFVDCEAAIAVLVDTRTYEVTRRAYTVSKRWGNVLRARMVKAGERSLGAPIIICWTGPGPGVRTFIDFYGPDIYEEPAAKR